MDFNDQLRRYFATDDLGAITPAALQGGIERMEVDFGLETDPARRFALWTFMHMLGAAPDVDVAFEHDVDREAARDFLDLLDRAVAAGNAES